MSMDWEYTCSRCGKGYCVMHPDPYGLPYICSSCWTEEDDNRLANFYDDRDKKEIENLASVKLERIPMWIRKMFDAL